jgi:hypothetical protein
VLRIAQGAIAGVAAGIVTGIAARVAMRLVAIGAADGIGQLPAFTIEGTLAIVTSGAIAGAPFGAVYALVELRLPRPVRARGLWFGLLMLVFFGPLFLTNEEIFSRGRLVLFTLLFPIYGLAVGLALPAVQRIAGRLPVGVQRALAFAAGGAGALVLLGFAGIAGEAFARHGAATLAFAIPWIALAVLSGPALRARLARLQLAR